MDSGTVLAQEPLLLVVSHHGEQVVQIDAEGNTLLNPKYSADAAARIFWEAVGKQSPPALEQAKNGAYKERDQCVAVIARMALLLGYPVWLGRHVGEDWEDDWRTIVFIELPTGQVSWHIHDSELPWFAMIPGGDKAWDGHSTEEKYERAMTFANGGAPTG